MLFSQRDHVSRTVRNYKESSLKEKNVRTAQGLKSYLDIEKITYTHYGYAIESFKRPFIQLKRHDQCSNVFKEWEQIANTYDPKGTPPKEMPKNFVLNYTLNNLSYVKFWYLSDNKNTAGAVTWTKEQIDSMVAAKTDFSTTYGSAGVSVFHATAYHSIKGKRGLVIGSLTPWVEKFCLRNGAKKITTTEYRKINSTHPQIDYIHPFEMAKSWEKFQGVYDFVVSYSSIEHSGLGRFGDPLDPIGDLREMRKIQCLLKKGGLLFFGVPCGTDTLVFNAHRIYGRIRLPMMFEGFNFLNMFKGNTESPAQITDDIFNTTAGTETIQPTFVLERR